MIIFEDARNDAREHRGRILIVGLTCEHRRLGIIIHIISVLVVESVKHPAGTICSLHALLCGCWRYAVVVPVVIFSYPQVMKFLAVFILAEQAHGLLKLLLADFRRH